VKHKLYPNPDVLFYLSAEGIVATNSLTKEAYDLTDAYFSRLKFWDGQQSDELTDIDAELLEGGLVLEAPLNRLPWGGDRLSEFFHSATRSPPAMTPSLSDDEVAEEFVKMSQLKAKELPRLVPDAIKVIKLPDPDLNLIHVSSLFKACKDRKTSRCFNGEEISLTQLSDLLFMGFGYIHGKEWKELSGEGLNTVAERKSSPSGSGVQACDAFLAVVKVEGLIPGYYHYRSETHELALLQYECDNATLSHIVCDQFWVKGAACAIFAVVDMNRVWYKTDFPRGYGYVFLEAGHISQTLLLSATALGLRTWISASMRDEFIADKLGVDGRQVFPVTSVYIGHGTDAAVHPKIHEMALRLRK
jgi:SagB-type dehydrogenase family enzyme